MLKTVMFWAGNTSKLLLEDSPRIQPKGSEKSSVGTGVDSTVNHPDTVTNDVKDVEPSPSPVLDGNEPPSGTTKEVGTVSSVTAQEGSET